MRTHPGRREAATLRSVVHVERVEHPREGRVVVSLAGSGARAPGVTAPGGWRVVEPAVADCLERLLEAAVLHAQASGTSPRLDLDDLIARARRDATPRGRPAP